jgi:Zn-dependent protease with chaperone function
MAQRAINREHLPSMTLIKSESSPSISAVRNLLLSLLIASCVILLTYFAIARSAFLYLSKGDRGKEEIAWYIINEGLVKPDHNDQEEYYSFFQEYIQSIINEMPQEILPKDYKIQVIVLNDYSINAFAAPGGRIILTRGLLDMVKSENGLMFVIGHELGHLHSKDHLKEFAKSLSAIVVSNMFFNGNSEITALLLSLENHKTKQAEFAADHWGLKTLIALYGHAGGATEFFNILAEHNIGNMLNESHFASHPSTHTRSNSIKRTIREHKLPIYQLISFD